MQYIADSFYREPEIQVNSQADDENRINLSNTMDGVIWAREFNRIAQKLGYPKMDEGWLIGWFANAIMTGWDHHAWRQDVANQGFKIGDKVKILVDDEEYVFKAGMTGEILGFDTGYEYPIEVFIHEIGYNLLFKFDELEFANEICQGVTPSV